MVCAPPCDADKYKEDVPEFQIANVEGRTIFYNICQLSTKKGIDILLRAYYAAFADMPNDVLLVLKTYLNMDNRANDADIVKKYIHEVKTRTRIPIKNFPPVLPLVFTMSDDEIAGLHKACDAYVCTSRAEGWGIPVFDALGYGNLVISHNVGGLEGFIRSNNALVYSGTPTLFYDMPHSDPGLFTGVEQCFEPSTAEVSAIMRRYHTLKKAAENNELDDQSKEEWQRVLSCQEGGASVVQNFDYRVVHSSVIPHLMRAFASWKQNGHVEFEQPSLEESNV
jgi:glycosyltransferase involved in cell wall biosynthesis